ncbi:MAG: FAD-dependent oxidoreductase [Proteobacteria bacterium]|nr:FAD-dependent oxidoreductase [Pseudomonadota bacterium]
MKSEARVVIVGGGIFGTSLLYHLAKEGWSDLLLLEKGELTSGSTWHAAGQVPHFVGSYNLAKIHQYSISLYQGLEAETGQAVGWHGPGSIRLATNGDELDWFKQVEGIARLLDIPFEIVGPQAIKELHPFLELGDVLAGAHTPEDGHVDPAGVVSAMAKAARDAGATIHRHTRVSAISAIADGGWEVVSDKGTVRAEHVVNAAGSYGPEIGAMVGLAVPIVNMEHQYLVTEPIPEFSDGEIPVVRDPVASCYLRQEQKAGLIGVYERAGSAPWAVEGMPEDFDMELLPPELDRITDNLEKAMARMPVLQTAGIKRIVNGPITHTPDGAFLLGPAAGLRNFWMCCGSSFGISQAGGAGKYLAQWMVHGQAEIAMQAFDSRRFGAFATGDYSVAKAREDYESTYQIFFPGETRPAGRPARTTPLYERLKGRGAVFGDAFGWERPKWFAREGQTPEDVESFRRAPWFDAVGAECRAVAERAGLCDLTSFAKYEVTGPDAARLLDRLTANRLPKRDGGIVLSHMLTEKAGIECETTITRLRDKRYYLLSAAVAQRHDHDWLVEHRLAGERVEIRNASEAYGALLVTGPRARDLLGGLSDADLGNEAFPWLSAREIDIAGISVRALRVSYVGELGWELHHPIERQAALYDALMAAGEGLGLVEFGTHAMNALRMEKAYRAWGAELTTEVTLIEAGMERFVDWEKPGFIGKEALLAQKDAAPRFALACLALDAGDADAVGNEPVYASGRIVGITTSGAYGHRVGRSLAFAYLEAALAATGLEVEILGERRAAEPLTRPAYDPENRRLRA